MGAVLQWPPVVWAMRIALFVLLVRCSYLYLLLIAPFFRPANIRRMVKADLPRVRTIGAEIAGTRGEVEFVDEREDQFAAKEADLRALRQKGHSTPDEVDGDGDKPSESSS
jgi:hypothetical protein